MWRLPPLIYLYPLMHFVENTSREIWSYMSLFLISRTTEHANPASSNPNIFSLPSSHVHISLPLFFFSLSHLSTLQKWYLSIRGSCSGHRILWPKSFSFNRLVWGKLECTHSQPGDIQYDKKAGSYLITSCINTEEEEKSAYAGWRNRNKASCVLQLKLQPVWSYIVQLHFPPGQAERQAQSTPTLLLLLLSGYSSSSPLMEVQEVS